METDAARVCLACATPLGANKTNEHIIPAWLLSELGNTEEQLTQMIADAVAQETQQFRKPHVMDSFKEGRVCGTCNSGWMSDLETAAKRILPKFVNGKQNITQVPDSDALVIARWTLKTAVALSHATGSQLRPLPREHLSFLMNNAELPTQVGVFAASMAAPGDFAYHTRNHWENVIPSDLPKSDANEPDLTFMQESAYKVAFELKHLLLMAAYIPRASSRFLLTAGIHVPMWPNSILLPSRRFVLAVDPLSGPVALLSAFSDSLRALHV